MVDNIRDRFFFFMCLSLIFTHMNKILQMNFLGGVIADKLVFYFCFSGLIISVYYNFKIKKLFINCKKFLIFLGIYLFFLLVSLINGLYNFPYYNLIENGPITQIEKLPILIKFLANFDIQIDSKSLISFWMILRVIKGVFFEVLYTFGGAYLIYCWYHDSWKCAFRIISKAVIISTLIIIGYGIVDMFYLAGNEAAKNILMTMNPYLHEIMIDGKWWPPLLWKEQLRSVFAEPSHLGIYSSFCIPFLWYSINRCTNMRNLSLAFIIISFEFLLFLTQARTAVGLFLIELMLLCSITIILKNKKFLEKAIVILLCSVLSFFLSNLFIEHYMQPVKVINNINSTKITVNKVEDKATVNFYQDREQNINHNLNKEDNNNLNKKDNVYLKQLNEYLDKNLLSLMSFSKRSNGARFSIMIADLHIGMDYPFLGIGYGLRNAYILDYLPSLADNNNEVKMWIKNLNEKGILRSGFPKLGEYTSRFSETGILGLIVFLLPSIVILKKSYLNIMNRDMNIDDKLPYVFFIISLIGIMASGIGDTINITYCYWVLLGLGYAMCFGKENDVKDNGDTVSGQEH